MKRTAFISPCGRYRYSLTRSWAEAGTAHFGRLLVVMLNPSTADAEVDDPTIRRVIRFANDAGFGELKVVNLYAWRTSDPAQLGRSDVDVVGPQNDGFLDEALSMQRGNDEPVLAAWGSSQWSRRRAPEVLDLVSNVRWVCLGTTKDGSPRHPLYVPASQAMVPFVAGGRA